MRWSFLDGARNAGKNMSRNSEPMDSQCRLWVAGFDAPAVVVGVDVRGRHVSRTLRVGRLHLKCVSLRLVRGREDWIVDMFRLLELGTPKLGRSSLP